MQFAAIVTFVAATAVMAVPSTIDARSDLCPDGLYGNANCCATDILRLANLDCHSRKYLLEYSFRCPSPPHKYFQVIYLKQPLTYLLFVPCHLASRVPSSIAEFVRICADGGEEAQCCVIPVLGEALLCEAPMGA